MNKLFKNQIVNKDTVFQSFKVSFDGLDSGWVYNNKSIWLRKAQLTDER